jgi:hypothetical protein
VELDRRKLFVCEATLRRIRLRWRKAIRQQSSIVRFKRAV